MEIPCRKCDRIPCEDGTYRTHCFHYQIWMIALERKIGMEYGKELNYSEIGKKAFDIYSKCKYKEKCAKKGSCWCDGQFKELCNLIGGKENGV